MPQLTQHQSATVTKMLLIGESGSGKTGSLASLARAGYNLRVLDFDNGLDVLANLLKDDKAAGNVTFETCTDKFKVIAGKPIPDGLPKAWGKALGLMDKWGDIGGVMSWGEKDVLVIDSLTLMSTAILRHVLALNGRIAAAPQIQDWGAAMQLTEDLLALLYSDSVKCNVIITSHIVYIERDDGLNKGYPSALGNKLPPKVGRYFNTILLVKSRGTGSAAKRIIRTSTEGMIDLKHPAPGRVPDELPLETGMATFFDLVRRKQ